MPTIGDVALEAGVARSTVSAVLTGRRFVSPETKLRVDEAIAKLNFTVNSRARALATSKTMTLGLSLQFREGEFASALGTYIVAISEAAQALKYRVLLLTDDDGPAAIRAMIADKSVDGLILMNVEENDPRIGVIAESDFPGVLIGMPSNTEGLDAIDLDFSGAASLMVDRAREMGVTSAALLGWPSEVYKSGVTYAHKFRSTAIERAKESGISLDVFELSMKPAEASAQLREVLPGLSVEALFVHNDAISALLPLEIAQSGLSDLQVFSLHSGDIATVFQLPFHSVETEPERISHLAVEMLVNRISDESLEREAILVEPKFVTP